MAMLALLISLGLFFVLNDLSDKMSLKVMDYAIDNGATTRSSVVLKGAAVRFLICEGAFFVGAAGLFGIVLWKAVIAAILLFLTRLAFMWFAAVRNVPGYTAALALQALLVLVAIWLPLLSVIKREFW
jgi:hypothetical protein